MKRASVRERLSAGPVRGLGHANAIALESLKQPATLNELVEAACDSRAVVSIRAANALKKVQAERPELLTTFAGRIVRMALACEELRTRWNLTLVVGELPLKGRDRKLGIDLMFDALESPSAFLRTFAMQGLANFAHDDAKLKPRVRAVIENATEDPSAAMRARAKKLLTQW